MTRNHENYFCLASKNTNSKGLFPHKTQRNDSLPNISEDIVLPRPTHAQLIYLSPVLDLKLFSNVEKVNEPDWENQMNF